MTAAGTIRRALDRYLRTPWARWAALAAFVLSSAVAIVVLPNQPPAPYRIDFDVYRMGGQVLLDGGDLYGILPRLAEGSYLPFTYPPLAAALFSVFTVVPLGLGQALFTAMSIGCLLVVCRIVLTVLLDRPVCDLWWLATAATTVALWLEPVRDTLNFGQVNIVLMTLVVVDVLLGRGRWWNGLLVGLAISIKLTPAVFLLYFFVRRDWRALGVAAVSAVGYAALGHLLTPSDSTTYWTSTLFDTDRIGSPHFANNQSIKGELGRLGVESDAAWFLVSLVVGVFVAWVAWRLLSPAQADPRTMTPRDVAALIAVAFAALYCSPVAWDHSWVWVVPVLILLTYVATRPAASAIWWWLLGSGLVIFAAAPHQRIPQRYDAELSWAWWQHVVGSSYLLWGLAVLISLGVSGPRALASGRASDTLAQPA
ncbi:glycosyltransferase 87 family protein [Gordonia lacunae]|uniref:Mannosyltransferase n=1 Tax=Gordonia lacunae TaxID=417102 RepID=A0A2C9ZJX5_9ACTN|nr:glycosyltransferase 87 family protein [Gordonia lacunae]OUC76363.1 mannosyltransferase [Gordonia lacunae]